MECAGCGAALGPMDVACRYCRQATPFAEERARAEREREARAQAESAAGAARSQATDRELLQQVSKRAFVFSLLGLLVCFLPVFPILSLLAYRRARELAKRLSVEVPGQASFGLVLSALSMVALPIFVTIAIVRDSGAEERTQRRLATLESQLAARVAAPVLDWTTACALAESHALKNGYAGQQGKNLVQFDCGGSMSGTAGRPTLDRLSFTSDVNDKRFDVSACFDHGPRWFVRELRSDPGCPP